MKNLVIFILSLLCMHATTQARTSNSYTYLKIKLDDNSEISYPPGTGFVAEDASGNTVVSPRQLEENKVYIINQPITLWVFTSWNDEPDTYNLKSGKLLLEISHYNFSKGESQGVSRFKNTKKYNEHYNDWKGLSNGLYITRKRFFDYDVTSGYDASIEFNNGVIFYYRDGKAEAWQDGKAIEVKGDYLIFATLGIIKLSYNPENKELWYVFEENK